MVEHCALQRLELVSFSVFEFRPFHHSLGMQCSNCDSVGSQFCVCSVCNSRICVVCCFPLDDNSFCCKCWCAHRTAPTCVLDDPRRGSGALTLQMRAKVARNYAVAVVRKLLPCGLKLPDLPDQWWPADMPILPVDFMDNFVLPSGGSKLLQKLHPHPLDERISFEPMTHQYTIDGVPTIGSVTALVHVFAEKFDADTAIKLMINGRNWPRQEYMVQGRPMSVDEIKVKWHNGGQESANIGTWTHYVFELFLNRDRTPTSSIEFGHFLTFLSGMVGCTAFRTEWEIYGVEERIGGSIDFVAKAEDGSVILMDWKRTKNLQGSYVNRYKKMAPPLEHLDDCKGNHYRLQLNCYRYLLQKYYGVSVSAMFVVCVHPDVGSSPFVDDVPIMPSETEALMCWQRARALGDERPFMGRVFREEEDLLRVYMDLSPQSKKRKAAEVLADMSSP